MTTLRLILFSVLAVTATFGDAPRLHLSAAGSGPEEARPGNGAAMLFQLALGAGALAPSDAAGNPEWPCFTGNAADWPDCANIPAGGLVIGIPEYTVSLAGCTVGPTIPCAWLYFIVEDDDTNTASGLTVSIKVAQGSATLFDTGTMDYGPNAPSVYVVSGNAAFGPGNCPGTVTCVAPVGGQATITASMSVGESKVTSEAHINFQNETATALSASLNPSTFGEAVTFTAAVSSEGVTPTGTVTFMSGSTTIGTGTLAGGVATLEYSKLGAGSPSITAVYGGDTASEGSTSPPLSQMVNQAATSTGVASSKNPSTEGESVTFTATVASGYTTPAGTVTFTHGSAKLGAATLASGQAKLAVTTLPVGTNTVTATYNPSANFTGSSGSIVQTVN